MRTADEKKAEIHTRLTIPCCSEQGTGHSRETEAVS